LSPSGASRAAPGGEAWIWAGALLLFAGLHLWLRVGPVLRYDLMAPAFFKDRPFFARFGSVPGGPLDYAAAGFAQFGFHGWLGATAVTAVLAGVFIATRHLFAIVSGRRSTGAAGGLVVLLAMLPGRFDGNAEGTALGLLLALGVAIGWLVLPTRPTALRVVTFWALTGLLFYAAGTVPALWLVVVGMIVALLQRDLRRALACGAVLLLLPVWIWLRPAWDPWAITGQWGHGMTRTLTLAAWVFVPLWLGVQGLTSMGASKVPWLGRLCARHESMTPRRRHAVGLMGWILGAGLIGFSLDGSRRAAAQVEHSVQRQDWEGALVAARDLEEWPSSTRLHVTRALAHSGRLLDDLFAFPQDRTLGLLPAPASGLEMARALAQTLLDMLETVTNVGGTAGKAAVPYYRVAGKTGTSRKAGGGNYQQSRYLSLFAGLAPVSAPRLACVIVINDPQGKVFYGGAVAAPVFGRVIGGALRLMDVPPDSPLLQIAARSEAEELEAAAEAVGEPTPP